MLSAPELAGAMDQAL